MSVCTWACVATPTRRSLRTQASPFSFCSAYCTNEPDTDRAPHRDRILKQNQKIERVSVVRLCRGDESKIEREHVALRQHGLEPERTKVQIKRIFVSASPWSLDHGKNIQASLSRAMVDAERSPATLPSSARSASF